MARVNKGIQLDIRTGRNKQLDTVLKLAISRWKFSKNYQFVVLDVVWSSLNIPLAEAGAKVYASDISEKNRIKERATLAELGNTANPTFTVQDLETLSGRYHTVIICLDVLIHYP